MKVNVTSNSSPHLPLFLTCVSDGINKNAHTAVTWWHHVICISVTTSLKNVKEWFIFLTKCSHYS